jgi:hypothetical protein
MKMLFKTRYNYGKANILPLSPESQALFQLLKRSHLEPVELPLVAQMGFEIDISGDTRELATQMGEVPFEMKDGQIKIGKECPLCHTKN